MLVKRVTAVELRASREPAEQKTRARRARSSARARGYSFFRTKSLNAPHRIGAVSGPTLFSSPYCAFFRP